MNIYGLNIDTLENVNAETTPLSFVYAHGWLEESNGFDLVGLKTDEIREFEKRNDGIYTVEFWDNDSDRRTHSYLYFWHDKENRQHGLVCHRGDIKANKYARKKYNERAMWL